MGGRALPLAALIIVGDYGVGERPPMLLRIAGQTLLERLIRQLAATGANHIVLLVSAVPSDVVSVIDQLSGDGLSIDLARNASDAADRFHPDESLLVIDGPLVIGQHWFDLLRDQAGNTLVTVPKAAGDRFERIDAHDHWLGLARIDGATLRAISSELGDWALGPTLLRKALQLGAARIPYDGNADSLHAVRPETLADLSIVQSAAAQQDDEAPSGGWFARFFDRCGGRHLARIVANKNIAFQMLEYGALGLFTAALIANFFNQTGWSVVSILVGAIVARIAQFIRRVAIGGTSVEQLVGILSEVAFVALPLMAAVRSMTDQGSAISGAPVVALLAIWITVQWLLVKQSRAHWPRALHWSNDSAGLALIFGVGWMLNMLWAAMGLIIIILLCEHGLRQHFAARL
jgi:hypothetical protein